MKDHIKHMAEQSLGHQIPDYEWSKELRHAWKNWLFGFLYNAPLICNDLLGKGTEMQETINMMNKTSQMTRSNYHLTLGKLVSFLKAQPKDSEVICSNGAYLGKLESYRGYYDDLAFQPTDVPSTVDGIYEAALRALGAPFEGYKGGTFIMDEWTPLWLSPHGQVSDLAMIDIRVDKGKVFIILREVRG